MKILPFGIFAILIPLLTVNVFSQENYNLSLNVGNNSYYNSDSKVFGDSLYLVGYRPSSSTEALLTCFNLSSKSIQWNKESNETNNQHFTSIDVDQTGIYVGGYTTSPPGTNQKAKLLKYTHSGILIWEKTFDSDAVSKIQLLSDGSISFTLQGNNNGIGRISSTGSLFWIKKLNEISFNYSSISNSNSKILFTAVSTGTPSYIGGTGNDIVTFCSDYNGNILWSKAFGTTHDESILTSVCLENGQFLLSGMIDNPSPGLNYENLFIKIDEFGTILQTVANGTSNEDFIYDIIEDQDGNIVTAGKSNLANDAGLSLKLDNGLSVIWSKIFDGIYGELLYGVNQHESGYVLTGINQSLNGIGNFEYEIWISKLTNFGYVECLQNDVSLVPFTPVLSSLNIVLTESTVSEINVPLILISTPVDLSTSCIFECNYAIPVNAGNNQTICFGDTITLTGSGAVSYSWNAGIDNGLPFVPQMIGQNTYVLTGTDLNGCSQSDTIIISTIAPPNVNAGADQVICEGSSVTLSGTGATVYNWSDGIINAVAFQPPVGTHNYIVTGTSANGCTDIDTITVFVTPLPVVSFTGENTVSCSPVTFSLTNTTPNALNCTWDISNGDDIIGCGSVIGTISQVGCHDVTLTTTDNNGCSNSFTAPNFICVEATPNATFTASPSSFSQPNEQIVFTNNSSGANTYFWDFGDSSPSSNLLDPTHVYEVGVQDSFVVELIAYSTFACTDTSYLTIYYAKSSDTDVFIPTGFSPNNDGENDSWTISGLENYPNATINVFNRWGQLLFEGGPSNPTWNGLYLGELLPTADYYYIIDLGEGSIYNGVVTLKQ